MAGGKSPLTFAELPWQLFRDGVLRDILRQQADSFDSLISQLFNVASTTNEWEELLTSAGIGAMPRWNADGGKITYTAPQTRYLTRITMLDFAYGVEYTHKLKRAIKYPKVLQMAKDLGTAAMHSREVLAASVFNNGFSAAWTDGVALIAGNHPMANGSTASNLATGALSLSTLEAAVLRLESTTDDYGRPMALKAKALLHPPALRYQAQRLIWSPEDPTTANRAINPLQRRGITAIEWPWLTSATAWFILSDRNWLYWFDREGLKQRMVEDEKETLSTYHNAAMSLNCGIGDWRGIVGSVGP